MAPFINNPTDSKLTPREKGNARARKLFRPFQNAVDNMRNPTGNAWRKAYSQFRYVVRNLYSDAVKKQTSYPYPRLKGAWPSRAPRRMDVLGMRGDVKINHDLNVVIRGLQVDEHSVREIWSWDYIAPTAAAVGVRDARNVLRTLFPVWGMYTTRPSTLNRDLIVALHRLEEKQAREYIVALACIGAWRGQFVWDRLATLLCQGAWPWLGGYNKVYAKIIFVLMASICAAVDMGLTNGSMAEILDDLASCLIPRQMGWPWRIRTNQRLGVDKVKISAVPAVNASTYAINKPPSLS